MNATRSGRGNVKRSHSKPVLAARRNPAQLDLFDWKGPEPAAPPQHAPDSEVPLTTLPDEALVAALADAKGSAARALADEAGRRGLQDAVPALAALYRRFKGFDTRKVQSEQSAVMTALAAIGGAAARSAVTALLNDGAVQPPGLAAAMEAAAFLSCRLPQGLAEALLRHTDPDIRAHAAQCAPRAAAPVLLDLLADPNPHPAGAAACALGRLGRKEARPALLRLLATDPSAAVIEAAAAIPNNAIIVALGRIARAGGDLAQTAADALADMDDDKAKAITASLRKAQLDSQPACSDDPGTGGAHD